MAAKKRAEVTTPAIAHVRRLGLEHTVHSFAHDPRTTNYGEECARELGVDAGRVYKTLIVNVDGAHVVAVLPVASRAQLKLIAQTCDGKRAELATERDVERRTGYVLGGVSPFGQRHKLPTVIDASVTQWDTVFVSAGRRGLDLEIAPHDLIAGSEARVAHIIQ